MTVQAGPSAELLALRELADDIFAGSTEPMLDVQDLALPYDQALWDTLSSAGLTLLTTPEGDGGSGAGLPELAVVLESAGYHSAPAPLTEHDLLASWLLRTAELPVPDGLMTAAVSGARLRDGRLVTLLDCVPWASAAQTLVVAGDGFVAALSPDQYSVEITHDIAGQPLGQVAIDTPLSASQYSRTDSDRSAEFEVRGALGRAAQTCGALDRVLELCCAHVQQRTQFGRPIAKFQAVQALVANAAGAVSTAKTATAFAVERAAAHGLRSPQADFAIAVAKIESVRAATTVARNAHQVHGAIGFTLDHRLRHFTTRALAWRSEFGGQRQWQERLGRMALESSSTAWQLVTDLSSTGLPEINY